MPDFGHFAIINYEKQVHDETLSSINAPIIFDVVIDQTKRKNSRYFAKKEKITTNVFRNGNRNRLDEQFSNQHDDDHKELHTG